jgi:Xaa-Pro aminopeptidase
MEHPIESRYPMQGLTKGVSTRELERRWALARDIMSEHKVDYLIMRNDEEYLGGYIKWFSDFSARHSYPMTVIFPRDDEMTLIGNGPFPPGEPAPPQWAVRGVKQRLNAPFFPTAHYTHVYEAEYAVSVLKEKKNPVIGLVGESFIPANFYTYLKRQLPGATFMEFSDPIDEIKAVKSAEEIELIKETASLQDDVIEALRGFIRPGMREVDIFAEAERAATISGSERQLVLVGSGPKGEPAPFKMRRFQTRVVEEGDQVAVLIEISGPGGFYGEIARHFSIGPPAQELLDAVAAAAEVQQHSVDLLKTGACPGDILEANNALLAQKGYGPELRIYAHGQGYDLVERPLFIKDETMTVQPGMNLAIHPMVVTESVWGVVCENYLIEADGAVACLHRTPQEVIVI